MLDRPRGAIVPMSEVTFPVEFAIAATPLSLQASTASRQRWQSRLASAAKAALPEWVWLDDRAIAVTIFYFPPAAMQGDIDNIVKPILDSLCTVAYRDDQVVDRVWVQKFEPGSLYTFRDPSPTLAAALETQAPVLYIRIDDGVSRGDFP